MTLQLSFDIFLDHDEQKKKKIISVKVRQLNSVVLHFKGVFACPPSTLILIIAQTLPQNSHCPFQMQI